jgi:hypothetical protein
MFDIKKIQGMPLTEAAKLVATQIEDVVNECQEEDNPAPENITQLPDLLKKIAKVSENARLLLLVTNIRLGSAAQNIQMKMLESDSTPT